MTHTDINPFRRLPPTAAHHGRGRRRRPLRRHRRPGRTRRRLTRERRQAVPDHRARHHRPARQRLQLGLLPQRDLQRQPRLNNIGVAKAATPDRDGARRARRRPLHHARRRRHHPGHAARLLLRQDRADHRRVQQAPDGHGDERHRLRRGRARQPRVQLRPGHPARLRGPVRPPAAVGQLGRLGHRRADLPAVRHEVHRPARRARSPSASSAWSPPAWRSGTPRTSRARCASPASSSRRRSWCPG